MDVLVVLAGVQIQHRSPTTGWVNVNTIEVEIRFSATLCAISRSGRTPARW